MQAFKRYFLPVALLVCAVILKFLLLDRVPGINADEAVGAVWMRDYIAGNSSWPWWTPTGRVLMPLYPALVLAIAEAFPPGFGYMRLVPVISHLALLLAAWCTYDRSRPTDDRLLFVLLLASLPLHTAFARIAWEPCLIPLFCYLTLQCAAQRKFVTAWLMQLVAVLTHSTCIFLAPLLLILWADDLREPRTKSSDRLRAGGLFLLALAATAALAKFVSGAATETVGGNAGAAVWHRIIDVKGWLDFLGLLFYTATGKAAFSEFTGTPLDSRFLPSTRVLGLLVIAACAALMLLFVRRGRRRSAIFLGGFTVSAAGLYVIAGPLPVSVGYQRYALWMGVPLVFVLHDALALSRWRKSATLHLCACMLAYTAYGYFYKSLTTPGGAYPAVYATAPSEPKRAAFEWVLADSKNGPAEATDHRPAATPVLVDSWWLYWTGRYWLYDEPLTFLHAENPIPTGLPIDRQVTTVTEVRHILERGGYVVAFANGPLAQLIHANGIADSFGSVQFNDAVQRPLITVWHGDRTP